MINRRFIFLTLLVVGAHLVFVFFDFQGEKTVSAPKKSIVVRTFSPRPKPKPKKNTKKASRKKPSTKPSTKNKAVKTVQDSVKKHQPPPPLEEEHVLILPKTIPSLQIDESEADDYFVLLAQTLKEELELPEYGDVKLELTLLKSGKVLNIRVLQATSDKNRKYLELTLPRVVLPPFEEKLKNEHQHTFVLTFCNEK